MNGLKQQPGVEASPANGPVPGFASAIYAGRVGHRRHAEATHDFSVDLFMVYLDLDEIDRVCAASFLWSARRFAPAWFLRADFLPDRPGSLRAAVLDALREKGANATDIGPIRLLTHLRYWGLSFNPVSIFYIFAADGVTLRHLLLEVHNTPWNQRHLYLVDAGEGDSKGDSHDAGAAKAFHVSPFMPMDMQYRFRFNTPAQRLTFHMDLFRNNERAFDATLSLRREEISPQKLNTILLRYPWMTLKVVLGIYWQALLLLVKGVRLQSHPDKRRKESK